ncbi:MAG: hypothetical protein ACOVNL_11205, partial [Prochlorococcaceae cyanobacterium]
CRYDWSSWRLAEGNVRTTAFECGTPPVAGTVAVHCETLKLTRRVGEAAWEPWRLPFSRGESTTQGGEDEMLASLCANVTAPSKPAAAPPPQVAPAASPAPVKAAPPKAASPKSAPPKSAPPKAAPKPAPAKPAAP